MTPRSIFCKPAGAENYFDPETRICWHIGRHWCRDDHKDQPDFAFGRCRSGRRWFWIVHEWRAMVRRGEPQEADYSQGWEDSEQLAEAAVRAAITSRANGQPASATLHHAIAADRLKELNKVKRAQRPPSDSTDSNPVEYLYGHTMGGEETAGCPVRFRITKRTAKRIFYVRKKEYIDLHGEPRHSDFPNIIDLDEETIGFVNRQKLEADGEVYNHGVHWCEADWHLHVSLEHLLSGFACYREQDDKPIDLRQLKAEMAAAHPDRGGSSAAFIAARERYLGALRRCSNSNSGPTK
jgi:hypothetical protein